MPIRPVRNIGTVGINKDTSPVLLRPEGWSDGKNVRFDNGSVHKITGHQSILTTEVQPIDLLYFDFDDSYLYADAQNIYKVNAANTSTEVSSKTYDSDGVWHSSLFNGGYTAVVNNTVETPQYLQPGDTSMQDLPAWPTNTTAGVLRPFQNVLVAGNLTKNTDTEQPGTILVSSQAAPGNLPSSWTVGAALDTTTADEFELANTSAVVEIIGYRDQCVIFTEDSIHSMQLAQGSSPTRVQNLNYSHGCLAVGCVVEFEGGLFVVDRHDIYTTSASGQVNPVANHKMRQYFLDSLNGTHYRNTFVANNLPQDEIWVCFPNQSADDNGSCNEALIWNYRDDTWTIRDLPNVFAATLGPIPEDGVFNKQRLNLTFNGYRTSNASQEQQVTASGTQSNNTDASKATFVWDLSGTANTTVAGVAEVQTLTVSGSQANTAAVVDVQSLTLNSTGRSNVIVPAQDAVKEIVEFGVDQDFDASTNTNEVVDFGVNSNFAAGENTAAKDSDIVADFSVTAANSSPVANTSVIVSNMVMQVDQSDLEFAPEIGSLTLTSSALVFTAGLFKDGVNIGFFNESYPSGTNTRTFAIDDAANVQAGDILEIRVVASIGGSGYSNASFVSETTTIPATSTASYRISNTSESIPAITGSFSNNANATTARNEIKTALEADAEFSAAWTHDTDIEVSGSPNKLVTRFRANTIGNKSAFTYTTTQNSGSNTSPYLNVVTQGSQAASFSISSTGNDIPAITGNFTSGANANQARTDLKTALNADAEFTALFTFDTDTEHANQPYNVQFGGNISGTLSTVGLYVSGTVHTLTVPASNQTITTTVDIVNAIEAASGFPSGVSAEVLAGSTLRITGATGTGLQGVRSLNFSNTPTSSITQTVNGASTSISSFENSIFFSDQPSLDLSAVTAAQYAAISDTDYEDFVFTITANDGSNTSPHLHIFQQGSGEIAGSGTATTYTLQDGGGSEVTTFTSHVTDSSSNDRANVLAMMESGVDDNSETPINYTGAVSGNVLTVTADTGGAPEGNWQLLIDNGGITGPDAGTMEVSHAVVTPGEDEKTVRIAYTITDPVDSTEYDTEVVGAATTTQIAGVIRGIDVSGWTSGGSGADVVWTRDTEGAVSSLFNYQDSEVDNSASVSGAVVETTAGVDEVLASSFSIVDGDTTLVSGTFASAADSDTAGMFIEDRPSINVDVTYDTDSDQVTVTYDDTGEETRPTFTITNPSPGTGTLAVTAIGSDSSGSEEGGNPSTYTITMPAGFSPTTVTTEVSDEGRTGVLEAIRDAINAETFTPSDINASVIGNNLILTWADFNVATMFAIAVDNDGGNGDITFGTVTENTISEDSTEIHAADRGNTFNGETFVAFVERKVMDVGDLEATKWSKSVYPLMSGSGEIDIKVMGTNTAGKLVDFTNTKVHKFDIEEEYKVDPRDNGRFFNIRFETDDNDTWTLDGYSVTVEEGDKR